MLLLIFGLWLVGVQAKGSPFNTYDVFLSPVAAPGGCSVDDAAGFRNRTYRLRGRIYPMGGPLAFKSGKNVERNPLEKVEWETTLSAPEVVRVGGQPAVMLVFGSDHVGGTGSATHILVARCDDRQLHILFEAAAEGIRDVVVSADQIRVKRWIWSETDGHCCPSGQTEERYRWNFATGRFLAARGDVRK
jgi:hypothetical protein